MKKHGERAHSKFSASGAERWTECSASVEASEGLPDKDTEWSIEGTKAHELLEEIMRVMISVGSHRVFYPQVRSDIPKEMVYHTTNAANFILGVGKKAEAEVMVETRIYLDFIHEEMFGTFDGAVLDHFGTLHVFDFKYGAGHAVSPEKNLQMIFYGLGLAHQYKWNFHTVRLWIIQPRIKGYDGPTFWDISIEDLRGYVQFFKDAVWRVENEPVFKEGSWCHWCKAKSKCPIKRESKLKNGADLFSANPIKGKDSNNGLKKESQKESFKSEAQWRKESKDRKKGKEKSRKKESEAKAESGDFY